MEVNKTEALTPTSGGGKRSLDRQHADDQEDNKSDDEQPRRDAFEVDGELDGSISPKVQQMLSDLAAQIEPLRTDLQRSQARERELRDRIERHPYLPVLNRQGLEHELARVVGHIQGLGSAAFACISITNAEQIRQEHGRDVYEKAMAHACEVVGDLLSSVDIVGCLGGHDLGVLLLAPDDDPVGQLNARLQNAMSQHLFAFRQSAITLQVAFGGIRLQAGQTFAQALESADNDMKERAPH